MGTIGKEIYSAVHYLSTVCEQAELLLDAIKGDFDVPGWAPDTWASDLEMDRSEWLYTGALLSRNVRKSGGRGKPAKIGSLAVLIDIGCPSGLASIAGQAVVVVAWDCHGGWLAENFNIESKNNWRVLEGEKVIRWIPDDDTNEEQPSLSRFREVSWFYVLPLDEFRNKRDVGRLIADPLDKLTNGAHAQALMGLPVLKMAVEGDTVSLVEG